MHCTGLPRNLRSILGRRKDFSVLQCPQTDSRAHSFCWLMGPWCFFYGGKAAGSLSWPLTAICCRGEKCIDPYLHSPICLRGVFGNNFAFALRKSESASVLSMLVVLLLKHLCFFKRLKNFVRFRGTVFWLQNTFGENSLLNWKLTS
jgi:hypothetical protein